MTETTLQHLLVPTLEVCPRSDLYVRPGPGTELSTLDRCLRLEPGGEITLDTYFGCFSVARWAESTTVGTVGLELDLAGCVEVEVVHADDDRAERVVASRVLASDGRGDGEGGTTRIALPPLAELGTGSLYVRMRGVEGRSTVRGGRWLTRDPPARDVRLGVVITTFNRADYVRASIERLLAAGDQAPQLGRDMRILVVDNGCNLELGTPAGDGVRVVPNPNVGGAGGFARGLRLLREGSWATHALFMDDDVRFEPESVLRAHAMLRFARDPLLCVHGSMLRTDRPSELFEAGSDYRRRAVSPLEPLGRGRDLADWYAVRQGDHDPSFDYAAWWFFAFPLALTRDNPLPMFIRGDDVAWGLLHEGRHTVTAPGIAVWHDDFETKLSPTGWYYETRNFALVDVLAGEDFRWWHMERRFLESVLRPLLAFKYETAEHVLLAMRHFLAGPEWWMAIDQARLHADLRNGDGERIRPLPREDAAIPLAPPAPMLRRLAGAAVAVATLGGNLLPRRFRARRPPAAVPLQNRGLIASLTRDRVVYRHELRPEGFVARRDRPRFFALLWRSIGVALAIALRFERVAGSYRQAYGRMVSDDYWVSQTTRV